MESLARSQKALLFVLYGLLALMVIFSTLAIQNRGPEGYQKCIQKKCEQKGEEFCSKQREIMNCCAGAGGQLGLQDNKLGCVFN